MGKDIDVERRMDAIAKKYQEHINKNTFVVTGVEHGSLVQAKNIEDAIRVFRMIYDNEEVIAARETSQPAFAY